MSCVYLSNQSPDPVLLLTLGDPSGHREVSPEETARVGAPIPRIDDRAGFLKQAVNLLIDLQRGDEPRQPRVLGFLWEYRGTVVACEGGWCAHASPLIASGYAGPFDLIITGDGCLTGAKST